MNTVEEFKNYVNNIQEDSSYKNPLAFALGVKRTKNGQVLDTYFPLINWKSSFGTAAVLFQELGVKAGENASYVLSSDQLSNVFSCFTPFVNEIEKHHNVALMQTLLDNCTKEHDYYKSELVAYFLYDDTQDVCDAVEGYFKLQAISQRHVLPHGLNLNGIFGKLNNIAWTDKGPILPEDLASQTTKHLFSSPLTVSHVDKFPYLVNYHVPSGVRIASGSQVRLGAYLGEGTTVMPAGYVNFNAGTKGNAMIEGRISGGVVVDVNTDIGGGASIMGTLSGGNKNVISIGKECLLGANAGTGISLGDGCTIAAGVYVTAGAKIALYDLQKQPVDIAGDAVKEGGNIVKGMELNGKSNLLFIQDSRNGKLMCHPNPKTIELNAALHVND
ncbi:MAG: 2,3,4,5-tetrahydropyridine-2-carboxylate N-succinyltransferase [Saprospiraceae bacterium]|jgi:2,3,4,5-tetrahydropyridine-2-carboxylate N-succinyltransferase